MSLHVVLHETVHVILEAVRVPGLLDSLLVVWVDIVRIVVASSLGDSDCILFVFFSLDSLFGFFLQQLVFCHCNACSEDCGSGHDDAYRVHDVSFQLFVLLIIKCVVFA